MSILIPATIIALIGAYLSYTGGSIGWVIAAGVANAILWALATKVAKSPEELFVISAAWDLMLILTFTVLPIFVGLVHLSATQVSGVVLMILGFLLVKFGG